ncbi:MAG: hypothetical protein QE271_03735 [Bacteriovoracaceae bacterium]|nr:hypothetical protein [Bacteriovoracaceae bacterium]
MILKIFFGLFFFLACLINASYAQSSNDVMDSLNDDLDQTGDIFSDFSEDVENKQIQEDERFYRFGRFVSATYGVGVTTFTGNRGKAYHDDHPTFALGLIYFFDFRNAFGLGMEYSRHTMFIDTAVESEPSTTSFIGAINVTMLRPYFSYRYYVDTSDLNNIITYANPYFIGRFEYWYQTNKFQNYDRENESGGGIGFGFGAGIEIPLNMKKDFLGVEFLIHEVDFFDKETTDYKQIDDDASTYGYDNLNGSAFSIIINYVMSW